LAIAAVAYATLHWLGRSAGSTRAERSRSLPGDDVVRGPLTLRMTHATTIAASPECVWPWLVQMGWGRGGWYTARWVDRLLFPANGPSADHIHAELQGLAIGDFVPDGPPETGTGFVVAAMEPERHLVLHSTTHVPPGWAERYRATIDWTWAFVLEPIDDTHTRLLFRSRGRVAPRWLALAYRLVIVPADFVMSRQMMRGLKERVATASMALAA